MAVYKDHGYDSACSQYKAWLNTYPVTKTQQPACTNELVAPDHPTRWQRQGEGAAVATPTKAMAPLTAQPEGFGQSLSTPGWPSSTKIKRRAFLTV
jgi:hypothetical protein